MITHEHRNHYALVAGPPELATNPGVVLDLSSFILHPSRAHLHASTAKPPTPAKTANTRKAAATPHNPETPEISVGI